MKLPIGLKIGRVAGRPENGPWLSLAVEDPVFRGIEVLHLYDRGGRINPPKSFPVAYLSQSTEPCRRRILRWLRREMDPTRNVVLLSLDLRVSKVLDLGSPAVRKTLGVSVAEITDPDDMSVMQAIGVAAHDADFAGVLYPRTLAQGERNLALFCDRTTVLQTSLSETCDRNL
jgi:RES domain-containing protein